MVGIRITKDLGEIRVPGATKVLGEIKDRGVTKDGDSKVKDGDSRVIGVVRYVHIQSSIVKL